MRSTSRHTAYLLATIMSFVPASSVAFEIIRDHDCDGGFARWETLPIPFVVPRCHFPANSEFEKDLNYAVDEWNRAGNALGIGDVFSVSYVAGGCDSGTSGDGVNHIFTMNDPNSRGMTLLRSEVCWPYFPYYDEYGKYKEVDIYLSTSSDGGSAWPHDCASDVFLADYSRKSIFIHELGHALGFTHEDAVWTSMFTNPEIERKFCSNSFPVRLSPDEMKGLQYMYKPAPTARYENIAASDHRYNGTTTNNGYQTGDLIRNNYGTRHLFAREGCPIQFNFDWTSIHYYIPDNWIIPEILWMFRVRWYLSADDTIDVSDYTLTENSLVMHGWGPRERTFIKTFRHPLPVINEPELPDATGGWKLRFGFISNYDNEYAPDALNDDNASTSKITVYVSKFPCL